MPPQSPLDSPSEGAAMLPAATGQPLRVPPPQGWKKPFQLFEAGRKPKAAEFTPKSVSPSGIFSRWDTPSNSASPTGGVRQKWMGKKDVTPRRRDERYLRVLMREKETGRKRGRRKLEGREGENPVNADKSKAWKHR